jgi:uncharacterized protein YndB with AHSA1/START domain
MHTTPLAITTPTDREIVMTRVFDVSRPVLFEAITQPEFLKRWLLGPPGWSMIACENDLRVGGAFRYVWRGPDGNEMAMHGVYREIAPPERIVRTESFDLGCAAQSGEQIGTLVLTERGRQTLMTVTVLYPSKEARDATLASGMKLGVEATYDRLAQILASAPVDAGRRR